MKSVRYIAVITILGVTLCWSMAIAMGGTASSGWAWKPLRSPTIPSVKDKAWPRNPIDHFILNQLEQHHLSPAPTASRRLLLRRASFGVTGLPPSPQEWERFSSDLSPGTWVNVVERLLANPQLGERWGRHWLDVARFAESSGFEHDYDRPFAFHYRDFVIQSLNSNLPYDQFLKWQLAGDEYEPGNPLALMATGFLGAGVFPTQITANEVERTRYDAMDDMLATTGTAMLGLTIGCARCHDHKSDPISAREYYQMLSTFTKTVRSEIELDLSPQIHLQAKKNFDTSLVPLEKAVVDYEKSKLRKRFSHWIKSSQPSNHPVTWALLKPTLITSTGGAKFETLEDGSLLVVGNNPDSDTYTFVSSQPVSEVRHLRIEALAHPSFKTGGPGRADNGNFALSKIQVWHIPAEGGATNEIKLLNPRATFEQNTHSLSIAASLDDNPKSGWAVDPQFGKNHAAVFEFAHPLDNRSPGHLVIRLDFGVNARHAIGRPRLAVSGLLTPPITDPPTPAQVSTLMAELRRNSNAHLQFSAQDQELLFDWWKRSDPGWIALNQRLLEQKKLEPKPKLTKVLVCAEGFPAVRMHTQGADFFETTHFLQRGNPDLKEGVVTQRFLKILSSESTGSNIWVQPVPAQARFTGRRRALAEWLTDVNQGAGDLAARVIVNRLWQHHFGQGLVVSANDFGAQGTSPSHPELLDYLAAELIRHQWQLKSIHRLILGSATYQQGNDLDPIKLEKDPVNKLVSRQLPRRLESESIRDTLLAVAGALDSRMYGPGVLDEGHVRRSIYFTVKRSQMIPMMQAFDFPEPLVSQASRPNTTVAPQALVLLNSPHTRSWSKHFAKRLVDSVKGATDPDSAVQTAYRIALSREPTLAELQHASNFVTQQLATYSRNMSPQDSMLFALTDFAQVMLSLNEMIYVE